MRVHSRCSEASPCYGLGSCRVAIRTGKAHLERGYRRSRVLRSGATCRSAPRMPGRSVASDSWRCQAYIEGQTAEAEVAVGRKVVKCSFPAVDPGYAEAIMLQGFGWDSCEKGNWYTRLEEKISCMKEMGVTHLWLPPPSQSVSKQGYMPGQLYNLSSFYGNKEELQRLNRKLRSEGISPLADVVINHRCADEQGDDGRWNVYTDDVDHHGNRIDWGIWAITGDDPEYGGQGNADTGADYGPAPDLDHANPALRDALVDWMNYLHEEIGYVGWRFDFAKGYAAWCTKEYVERTVGSDVLNVGELWADLGWEGSSLRYEQNGARQYIVDWIDNNGRTATAFDFPLKGILQEAVKNCEYNRLNDGKGKGPGVAGWWPSMAVTFVDNHDTGSTQRHWPFPDSGLETGYAYIITHPGIPCIFWDHFINGHLSEVIKNLLAIRKKCGIINASKLKIRCADHDMYVAQVDDSLVLKLGPRYDMGQHLPKESDGWKLDLYGKDFAIWTRT